MGLKPYLLLACLCVSSGVLAKNESVKISVGQEGNYRVVNVTGLANELTINNGGGQSGPVSCQSE